MWRANRVGKEARKTRNNAYEGRRKKEGNSKNLAAVTGLFAGGIKSKVAKKVKNTRHFQEKVLQEDLHGLLFEAEDSEVDLSHLRRNISITRKSSYKENFGSQKLDFSPVNIINTPPVQPVELQEPIVIKNRSKSLFREINKRILIERRYILANTGNLLKNISIKLDIDQSKIVGLRISQEIKKVDKVLSGEMSDNESSFEYVREYPTYPNDKVFKVFKPEEWVYKTPPSQKIHIPEVEESAIKPAVLCTTTEQHRIFELRNDTNIHINLEKFYNRQPISLDPRFLQNIANITVESQRPAEPIWGGEDFDNNHFIAPPNKPMPVNEGINFTERPLYSTNEHFLTLTSRPNKTVTKMSRNFGQLRKFDIFGAGSSRQPDFPLPEVSLPEVSLMDVNFSPDNFEQRQKAKLTPKDIEERRIIDMDMNCSFAPLEDDDVSSDEETPKKRFKFNPQMPGNPFLRTPSPPMFNFANTDNQFFKN